MNSTNFSYLRSVKKFDPSVIKGANRMTDKTAIEKAKEATERAKNQIENCFPACDPEIESDPFDWAETVSVRVRAIMANLDAISEAIAALEAEKPETPCAKCTRNGTDCNPCGPPAWESFTEIQTEKPAEDAYNLAVKLQTEIECGVLIDSVAEMIEQFAVAYHAEQCKACRKDRRPLPEAPRV